MQTYTGKKFYPLDPRVEDIDFVDIAHHLSMICRFGGASMGFYSVAEHCLLLSYEASDENALWALLHDAAEAYVGDMVRPLKMSIPEYCKIEDRVLAVIAEKAGLAGTTIPQEVKNLDTNILLDEKLSVMYSSDNPWVVDGMTPLGVDIQMLLPIEARSAWLARLNELRSVPRPSCIRE